MLIQCSFISVVNNFVRILFLVCILKGYLIFFLRISCVNTNGILCNIFLKVSWSENKCVFSFELLLDIIYKIYLLCARQIDWITICSILWLSVSPVPNSMCYFRHENTILKYNLILFLFLFQILLNWLGTYLLI